MAEREEFFKDIRATRNWGRWGADDAAGTVNLIDEAKRLRALASVQSGRIISLSYPIDDWGEGHDATSERRFTHRIFEDASGALTERIGFSYHGRSLTHIDALCHLWFDGRMWNDKDPIEPPDDRKGVSTDVEAFGNGILTRGVLLDIPRLRGADFVTEDRPVEGHDLEEAAEQQGVEIEAGDALVVYSGRDEYERQVGPWGLDNSSTPSGASLLELQRPGLEVSCVRTVRHWDVALFVWDMMDARPNGSGTPFTMHRVLSEFGLPLVDNAVLGELARACVERRRWDFLLVIAPLRLIGSTGSPVNPVAVL